MTTHTAYINGRYAEPNPQADTFASINPANGETLATLQQSTPAEIDAAVAAARAGQKAWAAYTAVERSRVLLNAVAILRARNDELAQLETLDTGKPLSETLYVDIVTGADVIEYYAGLAAAQKRRSQIGASAPEARFLLLKLASTKAPESAEVTKKINPINTANSDQVAAKG